VTVLDNLSRRGAANNLSWLKGQAEFQFTPTDIRDRVSVAEEVAKAAPDVVLHLAGQVAVTTSLADPIGDFETNAGGALNVLEAVRHHATRALVLYASTNKVYGDLHQLGVTLAEGRWTFRDCPSGVSEDQALDFHSPYGCSKGSADQYVLDYVKSFGIQGVVFRQSCIYGPHQFGIEDQGWLAWFVIAAVTGRPLTIYGDGRQVRDVLDVDDLLAAYDAAIARRTDVSGRAFNIGGGPDNTLSLLELVAMLEGQLKRNIPVKRGNWRVGDQKVFVCDIRRAAEALGWEPRITPHAGVRRLIEWVEKNREAIGES